MILPSIQGNINISGNFFYFGCDLAYFDLYGKVLANSLKVNAPWARIHCHLFNPTDEQLAWCINKNVSVSCEYIDNSIKEIKTYYACVRFIRIPEIFHPSAKIISLDCDSVAISYLSEEKFVNDTMSTKVFYRTKGGKALASTVLFGPDDTRNKYAAELKQYFDKDTYKWFLDQDVMDEMINKKEFGTITDTYWGTTAPKKKTGCIWTGKGDKKFEKEFQLLLDKYRD